MSFYNTMIMGLNKWFIGLFFVVGSMNVYSQATITVSGRVVDTDDVMVQDVAVCLRNVQDSSYITSVQTDLNGNFKLKCTTGDYLLQVTHLAFKPFFEKVSLDETKAMHIKLEYDSQFLDEVLIKGEKPVITSHNGNLLVDVSRLAQESESIGNLLNKLPGVTNLKGGGITLYGLPVTIYIDGVKQSFNSVASVQSLLSSIPATSIKDVELISIPDGSFDASSNAVIKIKSRERNIDGYYVKAAAAGTLYKDYLSGGVDIFYMLKKKNITFNFSAEYRNDYDRLNYTDSTHYATDRYLVTTNLNDGRTDVIRFNSSLNVYLPKNNMLRFNLFGYDDFGKKDGKWNTIRSGVTNELSKGHYKSNDDLWSGNIQYETSDSLPVRLNASYGIVYGGLRSDNNYSEFDNNNYQEYLASRLRMTGHQQLANLKLDADINRSSVLSIGVNGTFGKLKDDATYTSLLSNDIYVPSTAFKADENIIGLFGVYNLKLTDQFSMRASVRGEYTDYVLNLKSEEMRQTDRYWNVFPYYSLSYSAKNYSTVFGFVSGIIRPNYEFMLPGIRYSNDYSYTQGNPYLKPTRTYSIVWNNTFFKYAYLNLRYDIHKKVQGTTLINRENGVTEYTYLNFADMQQFVTYLTLPFSYWDGNLIGQITGNISYSRYNNIAQGYEIAEDRKKHFFNYSLKAYIQYQINRFGINALFNFYPKYSNLQVDVDRRYGLDLSLTYDFLKNRNLTLSLDANDLLDSMKSKNHYYIGKVYKYTTSNMNSRYFTLSLSYKFDSGAKVLNKYKPNKTNDIGRFSK